MITEAELARVVDLDEQKAHLTYELTAFQTLVDIDVGETINCGMTMKRAISAARKIKIYKIITRSISERFDEIEAERSEIIN